MSAARVLQWLVDPAAAVHAMARHARPGGRVVVLDYDHEQASWEPPLPPAARRFYDAFLAWRADAGMDNTLGSHLGELFAAAGLIDIELHDEREVAARGDADFDERIVLWATVAATRGHQMVESGVLTEPERASAERELRDWAGNHALRQTLRLTAAVGTRPIDA